MEQEGQNMRLIDADANIETMKKCAENPENAQALLCYRYAQRILGEAPTVEPASPWHRVEEEPENTGYYLTRDSDGNLALNFWSQCWGGWMNSGEDIRYWMHIEPPREEEE